MKKGTHTIYHINSIINISQGFSRALNNAYIVQRQLPSNNRLYCIVPGPSQGKSISRLKPKSFPSIKMSRLFIIA